MALSPTGAPNIFPVLASLKETVERYLPGSSNRFFALLDCGALRETTFTSLRHLPYIVGGSKLGLNNLSHFINVRAAYLGAIFISIASLVYSVAMAVFYTALSVTPLVFFTDVFAEAKKYWVYIALTTSCVVIGTAGTFIPTIGAYLNLGMIYLCAKSIVSQYRGDLELFEKPLIGEIKNIFNENRETIYLSLLAHVRDDGYFHVEISGALKNLGERIESAEAVGDLFGAISHTLEHFPRITADRRLETPKKKNKNV